jgi:hypothetical protein
MTSVAAFCRSDSETDSETFYTSCLELFEDPEEQDEVQELLTWWNRFVPFHHIPLISGINSQRSQIFPSFSNPQKSIPANSAYARIKERRAALKALAASSAANA